MNKEWEDRYLKVREENHKLREKQKEQTALYERLSARHITLTKQLEAPSGEVLLNQGRLSTLQDELDSLNAENAKLSAKLRELRPKKAYETARTRQTPTARSAAARSPETTASAATARSPETNQLRSAQTQGAETRALETRRLETLADDLKKKLLETNSEIRQLQDQRKDQRMTAELLVTIADYKTGAMSERNKEWKDCEELKMELKNKKAEYTLAKNNFDKLDKEYNEYLHKHKQLSAQAEGIQLKITEEQRKQRKLEADIKQLVRQRDHDNDLKYILDDMRQARIRAGSSLPPSIPSILRSIWPILLRVLAPVFSYDPFLFVAFRTSASSPEHFKHHLLDAPPSASRRSACDNAVTLLLIRSGTCCGRRTKS
jgi:chromosome segregation ATPase